MSVNNDAKGFIDYELSGAMLPTPETLKKRKNPFLQFVRFSSLNLRIMRMVAKGHAGD